MAPEGLVEHLGDQALQFAAGEMGAGADCRDLRGESRPAGIGGGGKGVSLHIFLVARRCDTLMSMSGR